MWQCQLSRSCLKQWIPPDLGADWGKRIPANHRTKPRRVPETARFGGCGGKSIAVSTGGHGGKGTIFAGPAGAEQLKLIKTWAKSVANEKREDAMALANRPTLRRKSAPKGFASRPSTADDETVETARFVKGETEELPLTADDDASRPQELPIDKNPVQALIEQKPRDPFDPDTFNRLPR